jgi:glutamine amidotransferase-like uncharacterized protein
MIEMRENMQLLSLERLGQTNRQGSPVESFKWLHQLLKNDQTVYQTSTELEFYTDSFPEGHIYPPGTILIDADVSAPSPIFIEQAELQPEQFQFIKLLHLPKRIGVYNGLNSAAFCYDPYKKFFDLYDLPFEELTDNQIRNGILAEIDLFVVPGGPDAGESYYAGLGKKGFQEITNYVENGGNYLGSCAGAYLPLTARPGAPESRMWLNLIGATDSTGLDYWRTGTGFVRIKLSAGSHPSMYSLSYGVPSTLDVIYWEGPGIEITNNSNIKVLAVYDEFLASGSEKPNWSVAENQCALDSLEWNNPLSRSRFDTFLKEKAAAVEAVFGKGKLVLFSFHPEFGSPVTGSWEASPTHLLLLNTILYLGSTAASSR